LFRAHYHIFLLRHQL